MGISEYAKANNKYKKENPKIMLYHTSGLPLDRLMVFHYLSYDDVFFIIEELKTKFLEPDEVVKTYKIPIERIIAIEVLTHEKILQHENATVDGGMPIKEAFGYIADRLEKSAQNRLARAPVVFTIAFYDKDNNIKNIRYYTLTYGNFYAILKMK